MGIQADDHLRDLVRQLGPGAIDLTAIHRGVESFGIEEIGIDETGKDHPPEKRDLEPALVRYWLDSIWKKS